MTISAKKFQNSLLFWFDQHGRKHLPWQKNKTAYRVWISEIMLQQTQVATVIPYYQKFMRRFPDILTLAHAPEDEVLHAWAGLGYYSRARNLHKAAKLIVKDFASKFPHTFEDILTLPGIGRSTAGAIISIAFNKQGTILDGNVKRVLARFAGITQPTNEKPTENLLWELAEKYAPSERAADYSQAIMDLGATLCTRKNPQCSTCPLASHCLAYKQNITHLIPHKKSIKKLPQRSSTFLIFQHQGKILLRKRPSVGIWGGLWSFPELTGAPEKTMIQTYCREQFKLLAPNYSLLKPFRHTFSHYHLDIHPILIKIPRLPRRVADAGVDVTQQLWYNLLDTELVGLPKPIQTILEELK